MKKVKMIPVLLAAGIAATGLLAGCKDGGGASAPPPEGFDGTVVKFYATYVNSFASGAYNELINTYNNGQGKEDNVWVQMTSNSGAVSTDNIKNFVTRGTSKYDIFSVTNQQFKELAVERGANRTGVFEPLDKYLTESVKGDMAWDQISSSQINVWRFNYATSAEIGNKHLAGAGADLLAVPFNSTPEVLFYNTEIFKNMGINMVSVEEEKCGTGAYEKLLAHGYAEYAQSYGAPFEGATLSENRKGEQVYKVFNNRIPMNWEELRCLSWDYQAKNSGKYGYMSEWWFNYGWSVGGDCVGWDYQAKKNVFTIGDTDKNYLALNTISVNGTAYAKGEVLDYEDMKYLRANASELSAKEADLYELPSMYDAFLEFNRLGVPANKEVVSGINGYGIAKSTTANRDTEFTAGNSAMLCESAENINTYNTRAIKGKFDIAPLAQYREYVGGSSYKEDNAEYLNVIGKNGWTGELKTVKNSSGDDVACVGEAISALSSNSSGLAIPQNISQKRKDDAFKFISWACGPEGQSILAKGNTATPNQKSIGMSEEFGSSAERVVKNQWAASFALSNSYVGDWSYFESRNWINEWSTPLNSSVRSGAITLTYFLEHYSDTANRVLGTMTVRIKGK